VLEKRVAVARQPVPVGSGDIGDAVDDVKVDAGRLAVPRPKGGVYSYFFEKVVANRACGAERLAVPRPKGGVYSYFF
jgi:hypothetical protein